MASPFSSLSKNNNIDYWATQLYMIPNQVQFCHHLTSSYGHHKALDGAYEELSELKDEIIEKLIGYTSTKFKTLNLAAITNYTDNMDMTMGDIIINFGKELEDYASKNGYNDIENLAQSYSGVGAQLKYLLNLK